MSGLMRNVIDQVLRTMGEEERAQQVNYVTDRMIEKMNNEERVSLLLAIIDRVMSNLSPEERVELASHVAQRMSGDSAQPVASEQQSAGAPDERERNEAAPAADGPPHPRERD